MGFLDGRGAPFPGHIITKRIQRTYQKVAITITNNEGSEITNFQVPITFNMSTDKTIADALKRSSVRFTGSNGSLLPHWRIYSMDHNVTFYVKVPSIAGSGTEVVTMWFDGYIADKWTGDDVFWFFDDFPGSSVDATKWDSPVFIEGTGAGTWGVSNSCLTVTSNGSCEARTIHANYVADDANNYVIECRTKMHAISGVPDYGIFCNYQATNKYYSNSFCSWETDNTFGIYKNNAGYTSFSTDTVNCVAGMWYDLSLLRASNNVLKGWVTTGNVLTSTDNTFNYGGCGVTYDDTYGGTITAYFDWVLVRKATTNMPTFSVGTPETVTRNW